MGQHASTDTDVRGSGEFFDTAEDIRSTLDEISDYLANLTPALQARLVAKMKREGVSGRGLLGTTEGRAAKTVTDPLAQVSEWLGWCCQAIKNSGRAMEQNVLQPIADAQALRNGEDPFEIS